MVKRKILWTIVALLSVGIAASGIVDKTAETYAEAAFKRALVTFAVARTLNGVISLAQGTELALEPGGVGVNLGIGQVLDPINDLVEQFSSVMLIATTSLGVQNILLKISSWWGTSAALAVAGLLAIIAIWWPRTQESRWLAIGSRVLLMMLVVRFIVPALVIGTNVVANHFLEPEQAAATSALEATRVEIEELNEQDELRMDPDQSLLDRLGTSVRNTLQSMNVEARLDKLKSSTSQATEHVINLIVLFVLQTIILPVVFVWLIIELFKGMIARTASLQKH
ncbi:MAG TPA: hypothetical protein PKK10_02830 [Woeseiaceae bacterium]|nr:hypothetical protein [Woeseiaceae bacterium]